MLSVLCRAVTGAVTRNSHLRLCFSVLCDTVLFYNCSITLFTCMFCVCRLLVGDDLDEQVGDNSPTVKVCVFCSHAPDVMLFW
jgi:hypothetical protein